MKANATVTIMYKPEIPDPNGAAIRSALRGAGFAEIQEVRTGKEITVEFETRSRRSAEKKVKEMCEQLLAHPFSENYIYTIEYRKAPRQRKKNG